MRVRITDWDNVEVGLPELVIDRIDFTYEFVTAPPGDGLGLTEDYDGEFRLDERGYREACSAIAVEKTIADRLYVLDSFEAGARYAEFIRGIGYATDTRERQRRTLRALEMDEPELLSFMDTLDNAFMLLPDEVSYLGELGLELSKDEPAYLYCTRDTMLVIACGRSMVEEPRPEPREEGEDGVGWHAMAFYTGGGERTYAASVKTADEARKNTYNALLGELRSSLDTPTPARRTPPRT